MWVYLWLKVVKPMVADTNATAVGKVVVPHRSRVNTLETPMEKNWVGKTDKWETAMKAGLSGPLLPSDSTSYTHP